MNILKIRRISHFISEKTLNEYVFMSFEIFVFVYHGQGGHLWNKHAFCSWIAPTFQNVDVFYVNCVKSYAVCVFKVS